MTYSFTYKKLSWAYFVTTVPLVFSFIKLILRWIELRKSIDGLEEVLLVKRRSSSLVSRRTSLFFRARMAPSSDTLRIQRLDAKAYQLLVTETSLLQPLCEVTRALEVSATGSAKELRKRFGEDLGELE